MLLFVGLESELEDVGTMLFFFFLAQDGIRDSACLVGSEMCIRDSYSIYSKEIQLAEWSQITWYKKFQILILLQLSGQLQIDLKNFVLPLSLLENKSFTNFFSKKINFWFAHVLCVLSLIHI
eukprot:TRINITY_DN46239_c0_g1_i1.p3 TRINITY_DN46239_c0_g1~~TRINITY_DN46239_c0_g1_i1.p3  ORF type:complete len:122 (+),score=15.64 TRINITY_DN46239_c0_g1_i1:13-378(+)